MDNLKKLKIVMPANPDYGEVVDSIADAIGVGILIEKQLHDGFQWTDALALIGAQPTVQEIINDADVFVEQFLQLNPDTARSAVIQARARLITEGKKFGKVTNFIIRGLFAMAESYGTAKHFYEQGQRSYLTWQTLIKGGPLFPDERMGLEV